MDDHNPDPDEHPDIVRMREQIKSLEKQVKSAADPEEVNALRREVVFLKAGIDPEAPKHKYFVKGYDGELTREAILAEAQAAGLIAAQEDPDAVELEAHDRMAAANTGGAPKTDHIAAIRSATNEAEVIAAYQQAGGRLAGYD